MNEVGQCRECRTTGMVDSETGLCYRCARKAQEVEKAKRELERRQQKQESGSAAQAALLRAARQASTPVAPRPPHQQARQPAGAQRDTGAAAPPQSRGSTLTSHPLHRPAWEESAEFGRASSTARHELLAAVRRAAASPGAVAALASLRDRLGREAANPASAPCAAALATALREFGDAGRVMDFIQALCGFADYRDATLGGLLPQVPAMAGRIGGSELATSGPGAALAEWLLTGARELAANLPGEAGPVRRLILYIRQAQQKPAALPWRMALLASLEAGACARAIKEGGWASRGRQELLALAIWASARGAESGHAVAEDIAPAVEAVVAYHNLRSEESRADRQRRCLPAISLPRGYLSGGYFTSHGAPDPRLFQSDAQHWASLLAGGGGDNEVTNGQIRRIFHEVRRIADRSRADPARASAGDIAGLAPLAADAAARALKAGRDMRALYALVRANSQRLCELPEAHARAGAFALGFLPHLETILALHSARVAREGRAHSAVWRPGQAGRLDGLDSGARARAEALYRAGAAGISPTLLRRLYGHVRLLKRGSGQELEAGMARVRALACYALTRSQAAPDAQAELQALLAEAAGLHPQEFCSEYLPHFQAVVAWFVSMAAEAGDRAGAGERSGR